MTITKLINEYVGNCDIGTPIKSDEIFEYVAKKIKNLQRPIFNTYLKRYEEKNETFERYKKGIYYRCTITRFGKTNIDLDYLFIKQMIVENGQNIGYETGPSLFNKLGLTTEIPNHLYFVSNKAAFNGYHKKYDRIIIKPLMNIDSKNYKYFQFLDILDNKFNVECKTDSLLKTAYKFMLDNNLDIDKVLLYASCYKNLSVYEKIIIILSKHYKIIQK